MKKDDATYTETPVEISGSDDQINKAKELIQEIIGPSSSVINNMGGMLVFYLVLAVTVKPSEVYPSRLHLINWLFENWNLLVSRMQ